MSNVDLENVRRQLASMEEEIKQRQYKDIGLCNEEEKNRRKDYEFGLCLGGGGGKGAYQIGVFKALDEFGLIPRIKCISGASIGALNALLIAGGTVENAYKAWKQIDSSTVFTPEADLILNGIPGIFSRKKMEQLIDKYVDFDAIHKGERKLYANATVVRENINKAEYFKLNDYSTSDIKTIVTASSSIPLIYEKVEFKDMELSDGGLSDNIPVKPIYDEGFKHIIIVGLNNASRKKLDKYTGSDFIEIYPSVTLGDMLDGTLNFKRDAIIFREMLGYKDAVRALKVYFECDGDYILNIDNQKENDLNEIKAELNYNSLDDRINATMKRLDNLSEKYI